MNKVQGLKPYFICSQLQPTGATTNKASPNEGTFSSYDSKFENLRIRLLCKIPYFFRILSIEHFSQKKNLKTTR